MNSFEKLDRELGDKKRKVLRGVATYAVHVSEDDISVFHHDTCILVANRGGSVTVRNGGWFTVTTKERINRYLPDGAHMYQKNWRWFLIYPKEMGEFAGKHVEFDGYDIITGAPSAERKNNADRIKSTL